LEVVKLFLEGTSYSLVQTHAARCIVQPQCTVLQTDDIMMPIGDHRSVVTRGWYESTDQNCCSRILHM